MTIKQNLIFFAFKILAPWRTFVFQGEKYQYFYHRYNLAWRNERTVEVPIVWEEVKKSRGRKILEVGNVLSHYFDISHEVVDKFERAAGVINEDVVKFKPGGKYDLIVSISTLEHVGWDEKPRNPRKAVKAIENLRSLIAPGGKMVVTLPLGYNRQMDKLLEDGEVKFKKQFYLKRISADNRWQQVPREEVRKAGYNDPFPGANGVVIGVS